ncbi:MAG: hypothetical protein CMJ81_09825 [Planctomycetaceae bacterium]|nr:hypothetical protein [Planctomycetaceae bacterium]MBP63746.1 hypothetical protein [Planctomycetaceae bacterium]
MFFRRSNRRRFRVLPQRTNRHKKIELVQSVLETKRNSNRSERYEQTWAGHYYRRTSIQALETRRVLTDLSVAVALFEDVGGSPGAEILDTVPVFETGDTFFYQVLLEDLRPTPIPDVDPPAEGTLAFAASFNWDPDSFEFIDLPFDKRALVNPILSMGEPFLTGTLDQAAGEINNMGSGAAFSAFVNDGLGANGPDQFTMLHFQTQDPVFEAPFGIQVESGGFIGGQGFDPAETDTENQLITVLSGQTALISVQDVTVNEGDTGTTDFTFIVDMSEIVDAPVSVDFTTSDGTATSGSDFLAASNTITFQPGDTQETVTVTVNTDSTVELDETFYFTLNPTSLSASGRDVVISDPAALGTITNDDTATISIADDTVVEGDIGTSNRVYTVTLSQDVDVDVTLTAGTSDDTALAADNDYLSASQSITFFSGANTPQTLTVVVPGDEKVELDETYLVLLTDLQAQGRDATFENSGMATGTITNDDSASISIDDVAILEGDTGTTDFVFTVTLSHTVGVPVSLDFQTNDASAETSDNDYQSNAGTLVFQANETTKTITVQVNGDTNSEADQAFTVDLANLDAQGHDVTITKTSATGTILTDDPGLFVSDASIVEGDGGPAELTFTVSLVDLSGAGDTVVQLDTVDGTATAAEDYVAVTNHLVTLNALTPEQQVTVSLIGDLTHERDETLSLVLTPISGMSVITNGEGIGTILNDDFATLSIDDVTLDPEGDSGTTNVVFSVSLSRPVDTDVTFNYATTDGTASEATGDYVSDSGTLTFLKGDTTPADLSIPVTINQDTLVEADEFFEVVLSDLTDEGRNVDLTKSSGQANIIDDDSAEISIDDVTLTEGDSGTTAFNFNVTLSQSVDIPISLNVAAEDDTAQLGDDDFQAPASTVTFASQSSGPQVITVLVNADTKVELDESFNVVIDGLDAMGRNVSITDSTGTGAIENDDTATVSISDVTQNEGDSGSSILTFDVTLSNSVDVPVSMNFDTSDVLATNADGDYLPTNTTVTIPSGSVQQAVSVTVEGDTKFEDDETFDATLSNLDSGTSARDVTFAVATAVGTISNDDSLPTISIDNVTENEPETGTVDFTFMVTLSNPSSQVVTVDFTTETDTAEDETGDGDFDSSSGQLVFAGDPTNELQTPVTVRVNSDEASELVESFRVVLSNAQGATVVQASDEGVGTIVDDPRTASLSGGVFVADVGVPGIIVDLTGPALNTTSLRAITDSEGKYSFINLPAGQEYTIVQYQTPVLHDDLDVIGTQGGDVANDVFSNIVLQPAELGTDNNFHEERMVSTFISKRNFLSKTPPVVDYLASAVALRQTVYTTGLTSVVDSSQFLTPTYEPDTVASVQTPLSSSVATTEDDTTPQGDVALAVDDKPDVIEHESAVVDNEPELINNEPELINDEVELTNDEPAVVNEPPELTNDEPAVVNESPELTNDEPAVVNEPPAAIDSVPQITFAGSQVEVLGTQGDDLFVVTTDTTEHEIAINDQVHTVSATEVTQITFIGGEGNDTAVVTGSSAADVADLSPMSAVLSEQGLAYLVQISETENITLDGGPGEDEATVSDSPHNDLLVLDKTILTISSEDFLNRIVNFELARAVSDAGGIDIIDSEGATDYLLQFEGDWLEAS